MPSLKVLKYLFGFAIVFLETTLPLRAQKLELDIRKNRLPDFIRIEQNTGGEELPVRKTNLLNMAVYRQVFYKHSQIGLPSLICSYVYSVNDSSIERINYEWDDNNFKDRAVTAGREPEEINIYVKKYRELYDRVFKEYGISKVEGSLNDLSDIQYRVIRQTDTWITRDSSKIILTATLTAMRPKERVTANFPGCRINLSVMDNRRTNYSKNLLLPGVSTILKLDSIAGVFIKNIRSGNFDSAKSTMTPEAIGSTSANDFEQIRERIGNSDSLVMFNSGFTTIEKSSGLWVLNYRFKKDKGSPPAELISFVFDDGLIKRVTPQKISVEKRQRR